MAASSPQMVSLPKVMERYLHMKSKAIECAFAHGQVFLDGRCLANDERVLVYEEVRGQMLWIGTLERRYRQVRLGTRPAPAPQMSLLA